MVWQPPGSASPLIASLLVATYSGGAVVDQVPVLPWLAMMALGWAFGKHISRADAGQARFTTQAGAARGRRPPARDLRRSCGGMPATATCSCTAPTTRWQQWLHVSKYPPSLTYAALELGLCGCASRR